MKNNLLPGLILSDLKYSLARDIDKIYPEMPSFWTAKRAVSFFPVTARHQMYQMLHIFIVTLPYGENFSFLTIFWQFPPKK